MLELILILSAVLGKYSDLVVVSALLVVNAVLSFVQERRAVALVADALMGTVLTRVGLPGLMPLPWSQMFAVFTYAMVSCLIVNDAIKVIMIRWRVPRAVS